MIRSLFDILNNNIDLRSVYQTLMVSCINKSLRTSVYVDRSIERRDLQKCLMNLNRRDNNSIEVNEISSNCTCLSSRKEKIKTIRHLSIDIYTCREKNNNINIGSRQ
jgi:hypothetical protein